MTITIKTKNQASDLHYFLQSTGNLLPQESSRSRHPMMIQHLEAESTEKTQTTLPQNQAIQIMLQYTLALMTLLHQREVPKTLRYILALEIPKILLHHHKISTML